MSHLSTTALAGRAVLSIYVLAIAAAVFALLTAG